MHSLTLIMINTPNGNMSISPNLPYIAIFFFLHFHEVVFQSIWKRNILQNCIFICPNLLWKPG